MTKQEIDAVIAQWNKDVFLFRAITDVLKTEPPQTFFVFPHEDENRASLIYRHNAEKACDIPLGDGITVQAIKEILAVAWPKAKIVLPVRFEKA